tara:strand:- start:756 stop:1142 length:387 start_codon:yes stop_codon:yes gene_type:complete
VTFKPKGDTIMSDVRTHLLQAKEEVRQGLVGALDGSYDDLIPELAQIYATLTEKLKVVRAEFGDGGDVVEFGGHLYDVPTQYNFNLESNVDLNTGDWKYDDTIYGDISIDTSNHPDNVVVVGGNENPS